MSDKTVEFLHEAIQVALRAGDFDKVRQLSTELGQAIVHEAQVVPPTGRRPFVESSLSRLREHLSLARVLRAHLASQLHSNTAASLYQPAATNTPNSWHLEA